MTIRKDIVDRARIYIDTPFEHQGRKLGAGVDCIGLVICVARDLGIYDYDYTEYARQPKAELMLGKLKEHLDETTYLTSGDVILFSIAGHPQHVGIYVERPDGPFIIHSFETYGKVVEHRLDIKWKRRVLKTYKFKEIDNG